MSSVSERQIHLHLTLLIISFDEAYRHPGMREGEIYLVKSGETSKITFCLTYDACQAWTEFDDNGVRWASGHANLPLNGLVSVGDSQLAIEIHSSNADRLSHHTT